MTDKGPFLGERERARHSEDTLTPYTELCPLISAYHLLICPLGIKCKTENLNMGEGVWRDGRGGSLCEM